MASSTACLGCAVLFTVLALGFDAVSFSTDYWVQNTVNDTYLQQRITGFAMKRNTLWYYHTRHNGLFKICFPGNKTTFLDSRTDKVDNHCLYVDYQVPESDTYDTKSQDYKTFINLMRCQVAFMILSMVLFVISFITGAFGCMKSRVPLSRASAILVFLGALCLAAGMAFFHGAEYLEKNKVKDEQSFPSNWEEELKSNNNRTYKWSYILGWVSVGLSIIGAILYLVSAFIVREKERDDKMPLEDRYSMRNYAGREYHDYGYDDYYTRSMQGGYLGPQDDPGPPPTSRPPKDYYYDPSQNRY